MAVIQCLLAELVVGLNENMECQISSRQKRKRERETETKKRNTKTSILTSFHRSLLVHDSS